MQAQTKRIMELCPECGRYYEWQHSSKPVKMCTEGHQWETITGRLIPPVDAAPPVDVG